MSRPVRYLVHILSLILYVALMTVFNNEDILPAFFLFSLFSHYVLLSPILGFKFWIRFIISIILWGVSFCGSSVFVFVVAFTNHLQNGWTEILLLTVYFLVVVFLYELLSSNSSSLKPTWLGKNLKRILRKMVDPHNQGIN